MPRASDHALRKLVSEIATVDLADLSAILAALDASQRAKVEALLAEFAGLPSPAGAKRSDVLSSIPSGLSPWLVARLGRGGAVAKSEAFEMTPMAVKALQVSMASLGKPAQARGAA